MAEVLREGFRWVLDDGSVAPPALFDLGSPERHVGRGEYRGLEFIHVKARSVINEVPASLHLGFKYSVNAYRGCSHACVYCFARPTHEYLGLGLGEDFERRIVVKVNAVELVRAELSSRRWGGDLIAMGTNTDPYQHAEAKYHLTRGIVKELSNARNPFSILTKSTLILRDLSLLAEAAKRTEVRVNLSVGTLDRAVWRLTEPGTPPPDKRLEVVRRLNQAGVTCGVLIAPVLPGLSDSDEQVRQVAEACRAIGAPVAGVVALHLRPGVKEHYLSWLGRSRPDLVGLYAERFAHGPYQPKAEQERLARLVRPLGRSPRESRLGRRTDGGASELCQPATKRPAGERQLSLFPPPAGVALPPAKASWASPAETDPVAGACLGT